MYVPEHLELGLVDKNVIAQAASFEGWLLVVDLKDARVVSQMPVEAHSDDRIFTVVMNNRADPVAYRLLPNLEFNLDRAANVAIATEVCALTNNAPVLINGKIAH